MFSLFVYRYSCIWLCHQLPLLGPEQAQARARVGLVFGLSLQGRPAKAQARSVKPDPSPHFSSPL
jgi:hypothetical protein